MEWNRAYFTATQLADGTGRVIIAGGEDKNGNLVSTIEVWDPMVNGGAGGFYPLGTRTPGGGMLPNPVPGTLLTPRIYHDAMLLENGKVLILGGTGANGVLSTGEVIDPNWAASSEYPAAAGVPGVSVPSIPVSGMSTPRTLFAATLLPSGKILAAGGWSGTTALGTSELLSEPASANEGYANPTPASKGTLTTVPFVIGAPWGTVKFNAAANVDITNYSWSITPSAGTTINSGQGTPVFNFNTNANGTFTINVQVTDQYGMSTACSTSIIVTGTGWTFSPTTVVCPQ
jgi:hypothetical protein